jgi:hypothetical protein
MSVLLATTVLAVLCTHLRDRARSATSNQNSRVSDASRAQEATIVQKKACILRLTAQQALYVTFKSLIHYDRNALKVSTARASLTKALKTTKLDSIKT